MVFVTLFTITLASESDDAGFLAAFRKLQAHCVANEPGTITYELHQAFEEGQLVAFKYVVLERYCRHEDFEATHLKSSPFQELIAALGKLNITAQSLQTYHNEAIQPKLDAMPCPPLPSPDSVDPLLKKGVLVFCGSRPGASPLYVQEAKHLAEHIATKMKVPLVYGGGTVGVMGALASAMHQHHGKLVSVIPNALRPREVSGEMVGDIIYYANNMSERKSIMFAHADTVIALPGGVGTFDELLEVITLFQLNCYRPKIGLVNANHFFQPFLDLLQHMIREGFLESSILSMIVVKDTAAELMHALESFVPPPSPAAVLVWHSRP